MDDVELDAVHVVKLAVERHVLEPQQFAEDFDGLLHCEQWLPAVDADVFCERIPPRTDAAQDAVGGEVVEGQIRRGQKPDIARPVIDDTRADFDT